jgi:predicted dehydrogenase
LLANPATRGVHDVQHVVAAAASSSSQSRAAEFLAKVAAPAAAKAYGSYHELVADPDIDIVYVATPHSHHFQNAMLALEAGKNVLCEKALTVNATQARRLVDTARAKGVFFMEAVWTRYFPLSIQVRELIASGAIGNVYRTIGGSSSSLFLVLCHAMLTKLQPTCLSAATRPTARWTLPTRTAWSTRSWRAGRCWTWASTR